MFNEKKEEWLINKNVPVWQNPKYKQSRDKAMSLLKDEKYNLSEADFWILMNASKNKDKMVYSGLIISHNGCLKVNDKLESKFDPSCITVDKEGFNKSLVYTYNNKEQWIYEVGEVTLENCKNKYPYAMAFKRCFDRVVLKLSKIAFDGIYSDSEADEFQDPSIFNETLKEVTKATITAKQIETIVDFEMAGENLKGALDYYKCKTVGELTKQQASELITRWSKKG